jgi:MFS family permease
MVGGGYIAASQAHSFGLLIVAFLVIGAGVGSSTPVPTAVVATLAEGEKAPRTVPPPLTCLAFSVRAPIKQRIGNVCHEW